MDGNDSWSDWSDDFVWYYEMETERNKDSTPAQPVFMKPDDNNQTTTTKQDTSSTEQNENYSDELSSVEPGVAIETSVKKMESSQEKEVTNQKCPKECPCTVVREAENTDVTFQKDVSIEHIHNNNQTVKLQQTSSDVDRKTDLPTQNNEITEQNKIAHVERPCITAESTGTSSLISQEITRIEENDRNSVTSNQSTEQPVEQTELHVNMNEEKIKQVENMNVAAENVYETNFENHDRPNNENNLQSQYNSVFENNEVFSTLADDSLTDELDIIPLAELKRRLVKEKECSSLSADTNENASMAQTCNDHAQVDSPTLHYGYVGEIDLNENVHLDIFIEDQAEDQMDIQIDDQDSLTYDNEYIPSDDTYSYSSDSYSIDDNDKDKDSKRKRGYRNKNWKRKGKRIKRGQTLRQRKKAMRLSTSTASECEKIDNEGQEKSILVSQNQKKPTATFQIDYTATENAIQISLKEKRMQEMLYKYHCRRLDKLLSSNMLERKVIPADGNCLLAAVLEHVQQSISVRELRNKVAKHLEDNIADYIVFVNFPDIMTAEEERVYFMSMIEEIKVDGEWNTYMSDFVPLCLANIFQRQLRIFSMRPFQPVLDVNPNISETLEQPPILVAHITVRGIDHYDAVKKKGEPLRAATPASTSETIEPEHTNSDATLQNEPVTPSKHRNTSPLRLTPHKDATYKSPKRKTLSRKKIAKRHEWKSHVRKESRDKGHAYISKHGKHVKARSVKQTDCSKCRFKCGEKINQDQRIKIFQTYWDLADYSMQRQFICNHIDESEPDRCKKNRKKQRNVANSYYLTVGQEKIRVCKPFFIETLDIGKKTVENAMKNKRHGSFAGKDGRGSHPPPNKTPEADIACVHEHIQSFPTTDPHYTRKDTKRKYLPQDLSIRRMHSLYLDKCKEKGKRAVNEQVYRNIFCSKYNMSFFHPKKDQCQVCNNYENLKAHGKLESFDEQKYTAHQERKKMSRKEKDDDKKRAKTDPTYHAAAFDLEAVLTTPCSLVGELYYKRKLCSYNLSFYSLGNGDGTCYLWDETHGKRGSCEIGSCILLHLNSLSDTVEEVTYYCDTCGGQNRNQFVAAALIYAVQNNIKINCINQKFLESGHSEMECDSIHATIEHAKKLTKVYVPSQWETVITLARKKNPYVVVPLKYVDFIDLKKFRQEYLGNMKLDVTGERVNWLHIKWIQVKKEYPNSLFVNTTFDRKNFQEVNVKNRKTRSKQKGVVHTLNRRYQEKLPISTAKKADLLALCKSGTIPEEYNTYYESLQCSKTMKDKLPAPGASENDDDTAED